MTPFPVESKNRIIREIDTFLNSKELDTLSDRELDYISKSLLADKLKEELALEIKKLKLDISALKRKWLSLYKSPFTARSYEGNLNLFLEWLSKREERNTVLTLKAVDIDDYMASLKKENLSDNTVRLRIAAVSSFLSYLQRIDVIDRNYCKGLRGMPKKGLETKSYDDIPSEEELRLMEWELRKELTVDSGKGYKGKLSSARMGLLVLSIIEYHGLRVGALPYLEIDSRGYFSARSKGETVTGKIAPSVLSLINELGFDRKAPFTGYRTDTIKCWFARFCKRLVRVGKLDTLYSLHDIRHYAAVTFWNETKDIYKLKNFLNHKSIVTTQIYLSSLNLL